MNSVTGHLKCRAQRLFNTIVDYVILNEIKWPSRDFKTEVSAVSSSVILKFSLQSVGIHCA